MKAYLPILFLLPLASFGDTLVDGYLLGSSGVPSVVTNLTTNVTQHITNSAFSSGVGGWTTNSGPVAITWYSNASIRAMNVSGDLTFPFELQYSACSPAATQTNAIITFRYWYADTNATVNVTVSDLFSHELGNSEMANGGAFVTSVVSINLPLPTNLTGVLLGFGSSASSATTMFFQAVSVTSSVVSSSLTTNERSLLADTLLVNPTFFLSNGLVRPTPVQ